MESKKIKIEEFNCKVNYSRNMIFRLLDSQINNYKLQFLANWEGDHSTSPCLKDSKIKELEAMKNEINNLFKECGDKASLVNLSISLDIKIKQEADFALAS